MKTLIPAVLSTMMLAAPAWAITATSTFEEGYQEWQKSSDVSSTDLNGEWKRVAVIEHKDCADVMRGTAYNENGLENADHSIFTLSFEGRQVQFLNVGSKEKSQGPYEVTNTKSQFSSWAYDESTAKNEMTDQAYGEYLCRSSSRHQIICAVGARLKNQSVSDPVFRACSHLQTGMIAVFTKIE